MPPVKWTGKLTSRLDGQIVIVLETNTRLWGLLDDGESGVIVPNERLFCLEARTAKGMRMQAVGIYPSAPHISLNYAKLQFVPQEITLWSETALPDSPWVTGAITRFDENGACRNSERIAWPPVFGSEATWHEWYCLQFDQTSFGLSKKRDDFCRFAVWTDTQPRHETLFAQAEAFLYALGFRIGQRVNWLAYTRVKSGRLETILAKPIPPRSATQHSPLPSDIGDDDEETLLRRAYEFFLLEKNYPVINQLGMFWDATDNFLPVQSLVAATVIEGLADFIKQSTQDSEAEERFARFKDQLNAHLIRNARDLVVTDGAKKDCAFLTKIRKVVQSTQLLSLSEKVRLAAQIAKIPLQGTEVRAWNKMRNRIAHGDFSPGPLSTSLVQIQSQQLDCAANIINKLVLGLIGYGGVFTDFSSPGWPARSFVRTV